MLIEIVPVPKPRMTQRDRWMIRPAVGRYRAFCDELRQKYGETPPAALRLTFYLPMPKSWSKIRSQRTDGTPHTQRPDVDNLIKAVLDALCEDDSYIYAVDARKYWSHKAAIMIDEIPVI